jgi:hypothetical protein
MSGAAFAENAEYVAIRKANVIAEAQRFLMRRYGDISMFGFFTVTLALVAVFAAYRMFRVVHVHAVNTRLAALDDSGGDNVDDPADDDDPQSSVWGADADVKRVPSGNQIRNRIAKYSKLAGRDLRADFDASGDDYPAPRPDARHQGE